MNSRTLIALWKANMPPLVWGCSPLWIGAIILALDGDTPEWDSIGLFAATVAIVGALWEFTNSYVDREEDIIYFRSNPFVTGELDATAARKAIIIESLLAAALLVALLLVTSNYALFAALAVCWFVGVAYSLPPFRAKKSIVAPFSLALGCTLLPVSGWLVVAPLNDFIIAFASFFFIHSFGYGITHKFRKTFHALSQGVTEPEQGSNTYSTKTIDIGLRLKTALLLEAATTIGAFALIPIFWYLDIFDAPLSIELLTLPLVCTVLSIAIRIKDPVGNAQKGVILMTMAWALIMLLLLATALASLIYWGYVVLVCIGFLIVFSFLLRTVHPFTYKAISAPWEEL
jgi:4-hydroxybenzoate polyprenyltransferase